MGNLTALGLAGSDLTIEQAIAIHLQSNHYPPVPLIMVEPCIEAINLLNAGEGYAEVELPEGVSYKGSTTAPVWAIIEEHHLEAWIDDDDID